MFSPLEIISNVPESGVYNALIAVRATLAAKPISNDNNRIEQSACIAAFTQIDSCPFEVWKYNMYSVFGHSYIYHLSKNSNRLSGGRSVIHIFH